VILYIEWVKIDDYTYKMGDFTYKMGDFTYKISKLYKTREFINVKMT
jgi:hypothetical protein